MTSLSMDDPTQWKAPVDTDDLSRQVHEGRELRALDLSNRDFRGAKLGGAFFPGVDFMGSLATAMMSALLPGAMVPISFARPIERASSASTMPAV